VTFSAEAECNVGQPTYKWNFGDGSAPSSETNPSHTYAEPGDYTASVVIANPGGATASDEVDITVEEGEGEPQD
jgi:PKD repeat protein